MVKLSAAVCIFLVTLSSARPSAPLVTGTRVVTGAAVSFRLRFRCAFDMTRLHACARSYAARLRVGAHVLRVQAVDPAGRKSPTTVVHVTVKAMPPPTPSVGVGEEPVNIAYGAGSVWVANLTSGTISRIDVSRSKVTATITIAGQPSGVAFGDGSV